MTIMLTLRFVFVLLCVFYLFQCEDEDDPITETRILRIHEIEAPETVSVSEESFTISLINNHLNRKEITPEDIIECDHDFFWDANRQDNKLDLTAKVSYISNATAHCLAEGGPLGTKTYQINGPFQVGDFRIIVHQPDDSTIEETVEIVE